MAKVADLEELTEAVMAYERNRNMTTGERMRLAKNHCIVTYDMADVHSAIHRAYALIRFEALKISL